jgi:HK97 family phage portal protein
MRRPHDFPEREARMISYIPGLDRPGSDILQVLGIGDVKLPAVTIETALKVPAVAAAVSFLPSTLAALPLHAFRDKGEGGAEKIAGGLQRLLNEAPNPEWSSYGFRKYLWTQVFTGGRGLAWIERSGSNLAALWPMDPAKTRIQRKSGRKTYTFDGKTYAAADVIDIPFLLKSDQLGSFSPIVLGEKAIQLAIAMGDYASGFFAGGGVPPLALIGPMPSGPDAIKRAQADIKRAIDAAKANSEAVFPIPSGYELKPVGFDPEKGQMTDARRFQIEEIARVYSLPPVFLQDLTHGTFSNTEQQDLHLTKHLIAQWARAFEEELNLKLFGAANNRRYVEHIMDGLLRGDLKSRMDAYGVAIQNAIRTPDEVRALENLAPQGGAAGKLHIQGATVPIGSPPPASQPAPADTTTEGADEPGA